MAVEVLRAQRLDDHREELGRGREVEGAVERLACTLVETVEHEGELAVDALVVERAGHVLDVLEQPREHVLVGGAA